MPIQQGEVLNMLVGKPDVERSLLNGLPVVRLVNVGTLAQVNTITTSEQTVTVPGLDVGDFVAVVKPTHQAGLGIVNARVSAKNTLAITFVNPTAAGITPTASEIYLVFQARLLATA